MDAVWPGVVVEENNLNQAISSLRKSLGDSKSTPRFIQTIPGRGYRFIAPVEPLVEHEAAQPEAARYRSDEHEPAPYRPASQDPAPRPAAEHESVPRAPAGARWRAARRAGGAASSNRRRPTGRVLALSVIVVLLIAGAAYQRALFHGAPASGADELEPAAIDSVAVMPMTPLNEPSDGGAFALGLHDELIQQLAGIGTLKVISRESVLSIADRSLPPDEIGRTLNADTVLTGTILYRGERARIRLQMSSPATGVVLWASSYEVDASTTADVIEAQSHIAANVASALRAEIAAAHNGEGALPTESFGAYRYLLAAKNAYFFQSYEQTFSLTREAIRLDPQFIDAHFYFATVNTVLTSVPLDGMTGEDHQRLAMESAERMIELAPHDSRGHMLKAAALATIGDWEGVAAGVEQLKAMGVSLAEMKFYAHALLALGDFDQSIEIYEANQLIEPVNLYGRGFMMAAHEMAGRPERARQEFLLGEELSPVWWGDTVNVFLALGRREPQSDLDQLPIPDALKRLLGRLDDRDEVLRALMEYRARDGKRSGETVFYGAIAAYIGEHDVALELMRDGLDGIWLSLHWMWLPVFEQVRQLPGFSDLLVESGVVAYWDRHGWPPICRREAAAIRCD